MSLPAETYDMPSDRVLHDERCMTSLRLPLNHALLQTCRHTYSAACLYLYSLNTFSFPTGRRFMTFIDARTPSQVNVLFGLHLRLSVPPPTEPKVKTTKRWEEALRSLSRYPSLKVHVLHLQVEMFWDSHEYLMRKPEHDGGSPMTWPLLDSLLSEVGRLGRLQPKHLTVMVDDHGDEYFDDTHSDTGRWTVREERVIADAVRG